MFRRTYNLDMLVFMMLLIISIREVKGNVNFNVRNINRKNVYSDDSRYTDLYTLVCILLVCTVIGHYAYNQYQFWSDKINYNEIVSLEQQFDHLSEADKAVLVHLNLAIKDDANQITLKYCCPITYGLIVHPVCIKVSNDRQSFDLEIYEKMAIKKWLEVDSYRRQSPLTIRNLIEVDGEFVTESPGLRKEHRDYIKKLSKQLNIMAPLRERRSFLL